MCIFASKQQDMDGQDDFTTLQSIIDITCMQTLSILMQLFRLLCLIKAEREKEGEER